MRYAIIGTGAIGAYYGGLLAKAGKEVHFLLRSDYEHVKTNGLQVNSCDGNYHLNNIRAYRSTEEMPVCDVVIVAMKTTSNAKLPEMLRPIVNDHSLILLIQNGIGMEEDLRKAMPDAQIMGGVAYICTLKTAPGCITHMSNGLLLVGNYSCKDQERLALMMSEFAESKIKSKEMEFYEMRWKKAVWNMPFNGMTAATGARTAGDLLRCEPMEKTIRKMMTEVINAAKACGARNVDEDYAEQMMTMTRNMPAFASSMKFDFDHHKPLELHYLYQRPIMEAERHGCPMPLLTMLAAQLDFMNEQNIGVENTKEKKIQEMKTS